MKNTISLSVHDYYNTKKDEKLFIFRNIVILKKEV